jgi:hypothetical protein
MTFGPADISVLGASLDVGESSGSSSRTSSCKISNSTANKQHKWLRDLREWIVTHTRMHCIMKDSEGMHRQGGAACKWRRHLKLGLSFAQRPGGYQQGRPSPDNVSNDVSTMSPLSRLICLLHRGAGCWHIALQRDNAYERLEENKVATRTTRRAPPWEAG